MVFAPRTSPRSTAFYIVAMDATPAMLLIRFAISVFALTLLGLALSLSAAQSELEANVAKATTLIHH
jgi:hypothetical protein